jgi:hypothetical protein
MGAVEVWDSAGTYALTETIKVDEEQGGLVYIWKPRSHAFPL